MIIIIISATTAVAHCNQLLEEQMCACVRHRLHADHSCCCCCRWDIIRQPDSIRLVLQLVYARHSAIDDQLVQCILEPTEHPQALDAFVSMVLSPAGKLSFEQVLQRVECPVCLAYGEWS
jgi:hypothetical protein